MNGLLKRLIEEPALIAGVVVAVLQLLRAFGVSITDEQHDAINDFVLAGIALAGAIVVRQLVTPNRKLKG